MRPDLLEEIEGWEISEGVLVREFTFENFLRALEFVNKVGVLAEEMNHHPDIWLAWGKVKVAVWTHAINDLTIVDFVVARAINQICEDSE
jgi:4a-hydroxytetrahydrobiopterin dehydratase